MPEIINARYASDDGSMIVAVVDGVERVFRRDPEEPLYGALVAAGAPIAPKPPTADDVRAEAARRMRALVGARDDRHLDLIISNGLREAARLLQKEVAGQTLTAEEVARKVALSQIDAAIEAVRAASNALEAMGPIPAHYADDKWWPAMPTG